MKYRQSTLRTNDNERLMVRHYAPSRGRTCRTLMLVHGMGEHGERYDPIARLAVARGWRVIVADHRGHGRSTGPDVHVRDFRQYVIDIDRIRRTFCCTPQRTFLVGHSMGGLISARYAQIFPERLAGLVLVSPLLGVKAPIAWHRIALARVLSLVAPGTRFKATIKPSDVTRDPSAWERKANDPLVRRSVTAGWFFAMRAALRDAWLESDRVQCPVLLVQAGQDRLVDPERAKLWFERLPNINKSLLWLPDSYHDVLSEPDWKQTVDRIAEWLHRHDFDGRVYQEGRRARSAACSVRSV